MGWYEIYTHCCEQIIDMYWYESIFYKCYEQLFYEQGGSEVR